MKINKKALRLIDKGLSANTVSKLNESQIDVIYSKLLNEQGGVVTQTKTVKTTTVPNSVAKTSGADVNNVNVKLDPNGNVKISQLGEDSDVDIENDPDATADGMGIFEKKNEDNKPNPWAICHTQVGPKKSRKWERCVREIKKQLGEGKNPVSLYLESQIQRIVEKNIPPRITKGDLLNYISESEPAVVPAKPKTKPTTKPDTKPRPGHPGKNPNPGEHPAPKAKKSETKEQQTAPAPTTKPATPTTKPTTKPNVRPSHPGKNPNPGEHPAPKAITPEQAKNTVIDTIMKLLEK